MRLPTNTEPVAVGLERVDARLYKTNVNGFEWWSLKSLGLPSNVTFSHTQSEVTIESNVNVHIAPAIAQSTVTKFISNNNNNNNNKKNTVNLIINPISSDNQLHVLDSIDDDPLVDSNAGLVFFTISPKIFGTIFSDALYSYSILTIYFTFVFSLGRFLRIYVLGISMRIIYEDMPNVQFVLDLVLDLYSARSDHEHALEEDMYGELIQLYRSPETLYEKTLPERPLIGVTSWPSSARTKQKKD